MLQVEEAKVCLSCFVTGLVWLLSTDKSRTTAKIHTAKKKMWVLAVICWDLSSFAQSFLPWAACKKKEESKDMIAAGRVIQSWIRERESESSGGWRRLSKWAIWACLAAARERKDGSLQGHWPRTLLSDICRCKKKREEEEEGGGEDKRLVFVYDDRGSESLMRSLQWHKSSSRSLFLGAVPLIYSPAPKKLPWSSCSGNSGNPTGSRTGKWGGKGLILLVPLPLWFNDIVRVFCVYFKLDLTYRHWSDWSEGPD